MINDSHCHFFSEGFFAALAQQRGRRESGAELTRQLGWDAPGSAEDLADRWVQALDAHGVSRAAIIASVPRDEPQVARAVARHPTRLIGFYMVDPSAPDALDRAQRGFAELGMRTVCLFPAMHHVPLHDSRVRQLVDVAASHPGAAVFVHCGVLSIGVRKKLGIQSRFDVRLGNPLEVQPLALAFPMVPFIIPHFGAGFFREALMTADMCSNVYLDTSSSNSWIRYTPGLTLEGVFRTALEIVGPSRLLFGTDSSFFPRGWQKDVYEQQKQALDALSVSASDQALIFGENFERLFAARRSSDARTTHEE
jgi:predicted TIM-barrel fold metal-dependent hydrolase